MMEEDATVVCEMRHCRHGDRRGYRWGTVTFIMPSFTALMVLVPIVGGALLFGEVLPLAAWLGVLLMIGGVVLTSVEGRPDPDIDEMRLLGMLKRNCTGNDLAAGIFLAGCIAKFRLLLLNLGGDLIFFALQLVEAFFGRTSWFGHGDSLCIGSRHSAG